MRFPRISLSGVFSVILAVVAVVYATGNLENSEESDRAWDVSSSPFVIKARDERLCAGEYKWGGGLEGFFKLLSLASAVASAGECAVCACPTAVTYVDSITDSYG